MPVAPTYPGVYVQEIPSGVRTITGVPTSITAFVGRTLWGPVNEPTLIYSFGDFQRQFGGLSADLPVTYAVRDFFQNLGGQALMVRLVDTPPAPAVPPPVGGGAGTGAAPGTGAPPAPPPAAPPPAATAATVTSDSLKLTASSPGAWGGNLYVGIDHVGITDDVANRYGLSASDLFNMTVAEFLTANDQKANNPNRIERYVNLAFGQNGGPRRVDRVLAEESNLVVVTADDTGIPTLPATNPKDTNTKPGTTSLPADPMQGTHFSPGNDGPGLAPADVAGDQSKMSGIFALDKADLFNLLCIPNDTRDVTIDPSVWSAAASYCATRRAMLIVDPPFEWGANREQAAANAAKGLPTLGLVGDQARNAAVYFPCVDMPDPKRNNQINTFVPCGIIAGVMAQTDVRRGVWKAPAGLEAGLSGVQALQVSLNDMENGRLNPLGLNCLRNFTAAGSVVWGARTARGNDQLADEYKYVPVRRLALFIEESLYRGTQWVVIEPNDEPLWAQIRLNVGAFMQNLFRQGAFQGKSPNDAYFVKCDNETTIQNDINLGIVNIVVGFAPLKPAEFVILQIQQMAGQIQA
jgi:phage tail sheath protein FI